MFAFYYLSYALFSTLIAVYLMDKGYKAAEVSFVVSASLICSMIAQPLIGSLNDRFNKRVVIGILLPVAGVLSIVFTMLQNILWIAAVYSLAVSIVSGINPALERMATMSRHRYGGIRIWGTIGFAVGSQVGGFLYQHVSPKSMYQVFALGVVLCVIGVLGTKDDKPESAGTEETASPLAKARPGEDPDRKFVETAKSPADVKHQDKISDTGKRPGKGGYLTTSLAVYLIIACLFYGAASVNMTFLPAMLQSDGLTVDQATMVILGSTLFEIPVVLFAGKWIDRLANKHLLLIVFTLDIIQFSAYAFAPMLGVKIIAALLTKAVATTAYMMINMKVIATIVDAHHQMAALGIVSMCSSFMSVIVQAIGGNVIDTASYQMFYGLLFGISVVGFLLCLAVKINDGKNTRLFSS